MTVRRHSIECRCGQTIAVRVDAERFEVQHEKRLIEIDDPRGLTIKCEECGYRTTVKASPDMV